MQPAQDYLSLAASQIIKPGMTPGEQALALNKQELSHDAVKSLAHGLPEQKSVQWATASAEKVSNPAHKADFDAIQAAKAWSKSPTSENQNAAALAAAQTDHKTPGAWAAQAAAWSGSGKGLTAHAVSGAVMLSAAQGGKPILPPGIVAPKVEDPKIPEIPKLAAPRFQWPLFKKPIPPPVAEVPQVLITGSDGLTLTKAQRTEMAKNTAFFVQLGCDIGNGRA